MSESNQSPTVPPADSITKTVARNSGWYAIEQAVEFAAGFVVSIAMARIIGPERLGYFNYVVWLVNLSRLVGNLGVPTTARKYMAEYLGRNQPGVVRGVFFYTLRLQLRTATIITAAGLAMVYFFGNPEYRLISYFLVASMWPSFVLSIPSQANVAAENYSANVPASAIGQFLYFVSVTISLVMGWNLLGIAGGILLYTIVELVVRMVPVLRWMKSLPEAPLDSVMVKRMRSFSNQSIWVMLLNVLVWNRSDIIFLKMFSSELAQISFYSVGFNLTEKVMLIGKVFGSSSGASVMAQYGRDKSRMFSLVIGTSQYLFQLMLPMLLGMAALSHVLIPALYGKQYLPAIIPLTITASLAILGALVLLPRQLLQATEKQGFLIWWTAIAAVINVVLDIVLIPTHGAIGAAIGNGTAQMFAALGIWWRVITQFEMKMPWTVIGKTVASALLMMVAARAVSGALPVWPALIAGTLAGASVYILCLRWMRVFGKDDYFRLSQIVPTKLGSLGAYRLLRFVIPVAPKAKARA